jgi:hypothetical protein
MILNFAVSAHLPRHIDKSEIEVEFAVRRLRVTTQEKELKIQAVGHLEKVLLQCHNACSFGLQEKKGSCTNQLCTQKDDACWIDAFCLMHLFFNSPNAEGWRWNRLSFFWCSPWFGTRRRKAKC